MPPVVFALLAFVVAPFRSRASLHLENLALRHQLTVYQHMVHRPYLRPTDRLFWTWLSRLWPGWREALAFVQPRTVIAWQRRRFRDYWRQLSQRGMPGRPPIAKGVRELIQAMWKANPRGVRLGSSGNCRSWASAWPKRRWRNIGCGHARRPQQRGRHFCTTTSKTSSPWISSSCQRSPTECSLCS
jgi:hypothetical protein